MKARTSGSHQRILYPLAGLPWLGSLTKSSQPAPSDADCFILWDKYGMLPNIRCHSRVVAHIATRLARRGAELDFAVNVQEVRASGLLHDLAKTYCLCNGGSHSQLGASWVVENTGNYNVAQGVMMHVCWPWPVPQGPEIVRLPFLVMYADKRVRHDCCVTLAERYEDLLVRYGHDETAREGICGAYAQGRAIEWALSRQLGWNLHEDTFDCGGLVS